MHTNLAAIEHLDTCDIEVLAGAGADDLGEAGDADAHQFAARALLRLLAPQPLVVHVLHGQF